MIDGGCKNCIFCIGVSSYVVNCVALAFPVSLVAVLAVVIFFS